MSPRLVVAALSITVAPAVIAPAHASGPFPPAVVALDPAALAGAVSDAASVGMTGSPGTPAPQPAALTTWEQVDIWWTEDGAALIWANARPLPDVAGLALRLAPR